jgi:ubiquinone/menaquinone biosynthesis C-methylase UbiE
MDVATRQGRAFGLCCPVKIPDEDDMGHIEHLKSVCDLHGMAVIDIGAGDGTFSLQMSEAGARVTAVEVEPGKVARIRERLPDSAKVVLGRAEQLPVDDSSQDLACMFFSLHHVPQEVQDVGFDEIRRVVRPGGRLHIVEPFPYGTMFDVVRLIEDETEVRTHSHEILNVLGNGGPFRLLSHEHYVLTRQYPSFDAFVERSVRSFPERLAAFERAARDIEAVFHRVVEDVDGTQVLHQPCAAYHFEIAG